MEHVTFSISLPVALAKRVAVACDTPNGAVPRSAFIAVALEKHLEEVENEPVYEKRTRGEKDNGRHRR